MEQDKDLTQHSFEGAAGAAVKEAVQEADSGRELPRKFAVFLHNDDYTTMEFVVEVLTSDFSKPQEEAVGIMLRVHEEGKAVAGIYSFDIAESKILKVTEKARKSGFPLKLTMEPVERNES
ncbi:MAG: ATP-dependent Clp protease adaptor ClpS [Proteobacteria bacterium]|nr:ATP-dependent Clp protease adaptor ClpS [Pseudomonadota bacterium]